MDTILVKDIPGKFIGGRLAIAAAQFEPGRFKPKKYFRGGPALATAKVNKVEVGFLPYDDPDYPGYSSWIYRHDGEGTFILEQKDPENDKNTRRIRFPFKGGLIVIIRMLVGNLMENLTNGLLEAD